MTIAAEMLSKRSTIKCPINCVTEERGKNHMALAGFEPMSLDIFI